LSSQVCYIHYKTIGYSHYQNIETFSEYLTKNETYHVTIISFESKLKSLGEYVTKLNNKNIKFLNCGKPTVLIDPENMSPTAISSSNVRIYDCLHENKFKTDLFVIETILLGGMDYANEMNIKFINFLPTFSYLSETAIIPSPIINPFLFTISKNLLNIKIGTYGSRNPLKLWFQLFCNKNIPNLFRLIASINVRESYNRNLTTIDYDQNNVKSFKNIISNSITIYFSSPVFDFNVVQSPRNILIGPLISNDLKLDDLRDENQEIINFIDQSSKIIYINMGSVWVPKKQEYIEVLVDGLLHLVKKNEKISIIYRVSGYKDIKKLNERIPKEFKNNFLLTTNFVPQKHILNNQKLKLVITHCGLSTIYESIYYGIPMFGLPIHADQYLSGEMIQFRKYGLSLEWNELNNDNIEETIMFILNSKEINENISKASKYIRSKNPFIKFKEVIDEVIEFGDEFHLEPFVDQFDYYKMFDDFVYPLINLFLIFIFFYSLTLCCRKKQKIKMD
jgi:hypothetical protein